MQEDAFRKSFIQNIKYQLINDECLKLDELFRSLNNDLELFEKIFLNYELKVKQIENRLKNYKLLEYDLKQNKFSCGFDYDDLGSLFLNKSFINKAKVLDDPILNIVFLTAKLDQINVFNLNTNSKVTTFRGDVDGEITCFELYDKNKIICGSKNGLIKVCNLTNATECVKTLQGHTGPIKTLKVLPNNRLASVSSLDKDITIWNLFNGDCMLTLSRFLRGKQGIRCLDQLPNGNLININVARDHLVRIWDLDKGECIKKLKGHVDFIRCVRVLNRYVFKRLPLYFIYFTLIKIVLLRRIFSK